MLVCGTVRYILSLEDFLDNLVHLNSYWVGSDQSQCCNFFLKEIVTVLTDFLLKPPKPFNGNSQKPLRLPDYVLSSHIYLVTEY